MSHLIECDGVWKRYRVGDVDVNALRGLSLTIDTGEFVAVMGASGSGKSTLLNILGCLDQPTQGGYRLAGVDVGGLSLNQLAELRNRRIGFVFQNFNLIPRTSALENAQLPLFYRALPLAEQRTKAAAALRRVGLAGREHHFPTQLSGGQQQRVAIARALAMDPIAILFDEPTSALDPEMIQEVLDVMVALAKDGMTMIVVTHEMGFARKVANRVIFMDKGEIVEDAPTADFFGKPRSERAQLFLSKILQH